MKTDKLYELRSKKTGAVNVLDAEEYEALKLKGLASRYIVSEITPMHFVNPPPITKKIVVEAAKDVKTTNKTKDK